MLSCFHCKKKIESVSEFSIEHKKAWLDSDRPKEMFFDLNNISFSHKSCNFKMAKKPTKKIGPDGTSWCASCKNFLDIKEFYKTKNKSRWNGLNRICKKCGADQKKKDKTPIVKCKNCFKKRRTYSDKFCKPCYLQKMVG